MAGASSRGRLLVCWTAVLLALLCLPTASAQGDDLDGARPLIEITPGRARAFRAAVQRFALELPDLAAAAPDAEEFRLKLEQAIAFSDVVMPLQREAYLGSQVTQELPGSRRYDCGDWTQSGADSLVEGRIRVRGEEASVDFQIWDPARCLRLVSKSYRAKVSDLDRMARRLADRVVEALTGARGVAETEIVFISTRTGNTEVTVMNADGGDPRSATRGSTLKASPSWMPRGDAILYTAFPDRGMPGLYVTSRGAVPPGALKDLPPKGLPLYSGVYSPAGDDGSGDLAVVTSVDGASEIFLTRTGRSKAKRLTQNPAIEVSPSWSPDGSQIAFVSDRSGAPQIYIMDRDGKNTRRVTFQGSYNTSPAWSPDGRWIAYETRIEGRIDIWLVDPTGEATVPVVVHQRSDESPTWSPDSRKLAFSSNRRGRADVYVVDLNGKNLRRLTRDAGENTQPRWGPFPE
jgi:TolB protein